MGKPY